MLITKELEIRIAGNVGHYYKNNNIEVIFNKVNKIPIELVNPESHLLVDAKCDVCGKEVKIQYRRYNKSISNGGYYSCSSKCGKDKVKKTLKEKYGNEISFKTNNFKEKTKNTFRLKYGETHFRKSETWKNKHIKKEIEKRKETFFQNFLNKNQDVVGQTEDDFIVKCNIHGECRIPKKIFSNRKMIGTELCVECNPVGDKKSGKEVKLFKLIKELYLGEIQQSHKLNKKEIDIFLPDLKIGFEFNGLRWHSELFLHKNYHIDKTNLCRENGIRLIHVFEDDFDYKLDIVKSIINNILGNSKKIYARKTILKKIESKEIVKEFLDKNHLQGFVNSNHNYGLYHNGELVSLMTFMKVRKVISKNQLDNQYELVRFCNKLGYSVVGGASKMFKNFIKDISPSSVISYCDISWANGDLYKNLGFNFEKLTKPNYHYIINGIRENRIKYQKHKLVKKGFNDKLTENDIMNQMGYFRIYNCGNEKYVYYNK
jgi:hypothetical protein